MKKVPVEQAIGSILCHDITTVSEGKKGVLFKRGHVIEQCDIEALLNNGKYNIYAWEESADEIHEDDAAVALAQTVSGANIEFTPSNEGKCLLKSTVKGLLKINSEALSQMNSVEHVTIATLPNNFPVTAGSKLGGARIIPLTTASETFEKALELGKMNYPILEVKPYKALKSAIIVTGSEVYYGRITDRFEPIIREKLEYYGAELLGVTKCPDSVKDIAEAIKHYISIGAELIILTGGMSVDPDDITPTAIRESGATVVTYGAPVQPGNMFMLGYIGDSVIMGVPGAAIHFKTTILDLALPRIFTNERLTKKDFTSWGDGSFCMGCDTCRYPICYFGRS